MRAGEGGRFEDQECEGGRFEGREVRRIEGQERKKGGRVERGRRELLLILETEIHITSCQWCSVRATTQKVFLQALCMRATLRAVQETSSVIFCKPHLLLDASKFLTVRETDDSHRLVSVPGPECP